MRDVYVNGSNEGSVRVLGALAAALGGFVRDKCVYHAQMSQMTLQTGHFNPSARLPKPVVFRTRERRVSR